MYETSKVVLLEAVEMLEQDLSGLGTSKRDIKKREEYEQMLQNMKRALAKFDDGTYGLCERCGKAMDADLLAQAPSIAKHSECPA